MVPKGLDVKTLKINDIEKLIVGNSFRIGNSLKVCNLKYCVIKPLILVDVRMNINI